MCWKHRLINATFGQKRFLKCSVSEQISASVDQVILLRQGCTVNSMPSGTKAEILAVLSPLSKKRHAEVLYHIKIKSSSVDV